MCLLQGSVLHQGKEYAARVLIDSGSSHQYISTNYVHKISLQPTVTTQSPHRVQVANGSYMESEGEVDFTLVFDRYRTRVHARILNTPEYDIILGLDWLRAANPVIDWQRMSVQLRGSGGELHELFPSDTMRYVNSIDPTAGMDEMEPVTAAYACRLLRQPEVEVYLYTVHDRDSIKTPLTTTTLPEGIQQITKEYDSVFRTTLPTKLPPTRGDDHQINTGDAAPININAYPLSPIHIEEQRRQISQLLTQGLIRESSSPWGFPVLFVKKPGGKWRMCVDFRALNAVTKKNGYPLPRIQECLDLIGQARFLTKLDLTQGYYQVRIDPADREKTAFNTREGKFEYLAMPFGLANAPATFQTLMNRILRQFIVAGFVIVYLDDIVIFSTSLEDHQTHLRAVFNALRTHQLYANPEKCIICVPELDFCGHTIGSGQLRPLVSKVAMITEWPTPTNVHEVRQFLGLATYYRRFIPGFAKVCVPLFDLLKETDADLRKKKFRKIIWTAQCEAALIELKRRLTNSPVLAQPDTSRRFFIETDASEWAIGCVLMQEDTTTSRLHPVAFDGRKLSPAEVNYPVHEKELLAIKYALQNWRIYIDNGHTTTIFTDHESLKYLATMRKPTKRLARWIEEFGEYDLDLRYRKGSEQVIPDALSRRPDFMGDGPRHLAAPLAMIRGIEEDTWAYHMTEFLQNTIDPPEALREEIYKEQHLFTARDDFLWRVENETRSPYVPQALRADFLERLHTEYGHLGYPGIMGIVTGRGWWHTLAGDIKSFVGLCPQCQVAQKSRPNQERETPQILSHVGIQIFDRWAIDLIGILPQTPAGNRWIITAIEYLTGWPIAKALPDAKTETIAKFIHEEIAMVYGPPKELLSDNGKNLVSAVMHEYTRLLGTKHRVTTPYHPRTNGKVENFNGFLGATLTRLLTNQPTVLWDQYLSQALFAIRVRIHTTSRHSPYYLLFGRTPRLAFDDNGLRPINVSNDEWESVLERIKTLQHARLVANQRLVNRAITARKLRQDAVTETSFSEGDWVLVRAEGRNKFEGRWFGPYRIDKVMMLGTYRLTDPQGNVVVTLINGQRLIGARVTDDTQKSLWNSSRIQGALRRRGISLEESSPEVAELFDKESQDTISYDELASIPEREWKTLEQSGDRSVQVREEDPSLEAATLQDLQDGIEEGLNASQTDLNQDQAETPKDQADTTPTTSTSEQVAPESDDLRDVTASLPELREEPNEGNSSGVTKMTKTRLPTWRKELEAGFKARERVTTSYGLRRNVTRKLRN